MALQLIRKGLKARKALKALELAKINAWRAAQGLPPLQPWYKECCCWMCDILRESFCPCWVRVKPKRETDEEAKERLAKEKAREAARLGPRAKKFLAKTCFFLIPGTRSNQIFVHFVGFITGLTLTISFFWFSTLELKFRLITITGITIAIGFFLSLGLAFVPDLRCTFLLMIPQFFTTQGKGLVLGYAFILIMNGPVQNIARNTQLVTASLACGQSMVKNITSEITGEAMAPVKGLINKVKGILERVMMVVERGKKAFLAVKELFGEICNSIKRGSAWLARIFGVCNAKMGQPYDKCMNTFQEAYDNCMKKLKVAKKLCKITTSFDFTCKLMKHLSRFCDPLERLKKLAIDKVKKGLGKAVQGVYNLFYVNITIQYHFNLSVESSKDISDIKGDILRSIKNKAEIFLKFANVIDFLLALSVFMSLFKACSYRMSYLTKDEFDNSYITSAFKAVESRRLDMGKEGLLPLGWRERWTYVESWSLRMSPGEMGKFCLGLIFYFCAVFHIVFYLLADYCIYWMIDLLQGHSDVQASDYLPHRMKIDIEGKGMLANMYQEVVGSFEKMGRGVSNVNTKSCIPIPYEPDYDIYPLIGAILVVSFFLVIFEAYGLRLRHAICDYYYPKRAQQRAIYLYNYITIKRGNVLGFLRSQLEQKFKPDDKEDALDIRDKLAMEYRCFRFILKCLGYERKYCSTCCKPGLLDDNVKFRICMNSTCQTLYCVDCIIECKNICPLCMMPIEPMEGMDSSKEIDSSDEEEYKRIKERKEAKLESPEITIIKQT